MLNSEHIVRPQHKAHRKRAYNCTHISYKRLPHLPEFSSVRQLRKEIKNNTYHNARYKRCRIMRIQTGNACYPRNRTHDKTQRYHMIRQLEHKRRTGLFSLSQPRCKIRKSEIDNEYQCNHRHIPQAEYREYIVPVQNAVNRIHIV